MAGAVQIRDFYGFDADMPDAITAIANLPFYACDYMASSINEFQVFPGAPANVRAQVGVVY